MLFVDRVDAGRRLAGRLAHLRGEDVVVLGLPRGGIPVGFEVARALDAPLDVIIVRKLGVPFQPELGMGAIGEDGVVVLNDTVVRMAGVSEAEIAQVERRERAELERQAQRFRGARRAGQVTPAPAPTASVGDDPPLRDEEIEVAAGSARLTGHLTVPEQPRGVVVFAHGSGSSRHSPRNRYVAEVLQQSGLATLLFDLLTPREETNRAHVFDIELLADRLTEISGWVRTQPECAHLPLGYFGASTGAAAALRAATPAASVVAVVSRGGRPDLTGPHLADVAAPTLLIVGGQDETVLTLNRQAQTRMRCVNQLAVVPGASHLFDEPGTLEQAAMLARDWFVEHLISAHQSTA